MEWKEKIGMEYGMTHVWNGMENLVYGMEQIFHINSILAYFDMLLLKSGFSFSFKHSCRV